jgi:hypothetical protein
VKTGLGHALVQLAAGPVHSDVAFIYLCKIFMPKGLRPVQTRRSPFELDWGFENSLLKYLVDAHASEDCQAESCRR